MKESNDDSVSERKDKSENQEKEDNKEEIKSKDENFEENEDERNKNNDEQKKENTVNKEKEKNDDNKEKEEEENKDKLEESNKEKEKENNEEENESSKKGENKNEEEKQQENENDISLSKNNNDDDPFFKKIIFNKYKPLEKIGEGSFAKVYKAEYKSKFYAVKFEDKEEGQDLLQNEAAIMSYLKGSPNIPKVCSFGCKGKYSILVMQLLGKSLEDIFKKRKKFSFKTGAMLAYQMLTVLEYIHEKHVIHRDIKPANFACGYDDLNAYLFLVDFGLAKKYRSSKTLKQYPYIK